MNYHSPGGGLVAVDLFAPRLLNVCCCCVLGVNLQVWQWCTWLVLFSTLPFAYARMITILRSKPFMKHYISIESAGNLSPNGQQTSFEGNQRLSWWQCKSVKIIWQYSIWRNKYLYCILMSNCWELPKNWPSNVLFFYIIALLLLIKHSRLHNPTW